MILTFDYFSWWKALDWEWEKGLEKSGKSESALKKEQQVILTNLWNESQQMDHAPWKNNDKSLAFGSFIDGSMGPIDCSKVCDGGYLWKVVLMNVSTNSSERRSLFVHSGSNRANDQFWYIYRHADLWYPSRSEKWQKKITVNFNRETVIF